MLQQSHLSVLEAKTADELRERIVGFSHDLGFERVAATTIVDKADDDPNFISLNNIPLAYVPLSDDAARAVGDPVVQHCKRSSVPITWSQSTYTLRGLGPQWEQQQPFGFGTGIALALHLPLGRHFLFGVNRSEALPAASHHLTRLIADVQLFAVHACEAANRLLLPPEPPKEELPKLTARELECLRWTMEGKTGWEVGEILGITERTVRFHVITAAHKLDCVSKQQAVVKAMRIGLIH